MKLKKGCILLLALVLLISCVPKIEAEPPAASVALLHSFDAVLERYPENRYVRYVKITGEQAENIDLWHSWVEAYQNGQPAHVLLYLDGFGWGSAVYEIVGDGTALFEIRQYYENNSLPIVYFSERVLKNEFQYHFAPDINSLQSNGLLCYKPIHQKALDYDVNLLPDLSETSAQEALVIAKQRIEENHIKLHLVYEKKPYELRITGAEELYGMPCYVITATFDSDYIVGGKMNYMFAINANGGNCYFMQSELDAAWLLMHDEKMQSIEPATPA